MLFYAQFFLVNKIIPLEDILGKIPPPVDIDPVIGIQFINPVFKLSDYLRFRQGVLSFKKIKPKSFKNSFFFHSHKNSVQLKEEGSFFLPFCFGIYFNSFSHCINTCYFNYFLTINI